MGIFKKEKMKFREIIKTLDKPIADKQTAERNLLESGHVIITPVVLPCKLASIEIDGYLTPRTLNRIQRYYRKKGYFTKISVICIPRHNTFIDFDKPDIIKKIEVYDHH